METFIEVPMFQEVCGHGGSLGSSKEVLPWECNLRFRRDTQRPLSLDRSSNRDAE